MQRVVFKLSQNIFNWKKTQFSNTHTLFAIVLPYCCKHVVYCMGVGFLLISSKCHQLWSKQTVWWRFICLRFQLNPSCSVVVSVSSFRTPNRHTLTRSKTLLKTLGLLLVHGKNFTEFAIDIKWTIVIIDRNYYRFGETTHSVNDLARQSATILCDLTSTSLRRTSPL